MSTVPRPVTPRRGRRLAALPAALLAAWRLVPLALLLVITALSGCSHVGVQPWERDVLAEPDMQLDLDLVDLELDDHIYFSKEASSGGRGFGGGGCGCN
jgi:hypothetical protein